MIPLLFILKQSLLYRNFQTQEAQITGFFANSTLNASASVIGLHYPNSILPARTSKINRDYYETLSALPGKLLWSSEEMSTPATQGGSQCLAKLLNRNYVDANLTSSIIWSIIYSW